MQPLFTPCPVEEHGPGRAGSGFVDTAQDMPAKSCLFSKVKQKVQLEGVPTDQKLAALCELHRELKDQLRVTRVVTIARGAGLSGILGYLAPPSGSSRYAPIPLVSRDCDFDRKHRKAADRPRPFPRKLAVAPTE